ncbi:hypothetical protein [Nostoc sp. UHCC 0252]|uniref:hypothetical protein n=1 Tax=Nostoc sp. UHCC 0252 TaxID=3110241 RepID=UPI002B219B13|nr:hypothetical protein [Nostoc sp. UHCC 0252]MEA5603692.1 hypothetical protein [Nostoc sp. UHCC 0252]
MKNDQERIIVVTLTQEQYDALTYAFTIDEKGLCEWLESCPFQLVFQWSSVVHNVIIDGDKQVNLNI